MTKIAIVGATGPTGIHLAAELCRHTAAVRVIARDMDKLARLFPDAAVEKRPADILDADATPPRDRRLRPRLRLRWPARRPDAFASGDLRTELNESHPRSGGPPWVRYRREAEDVLCEAG